jgi:hypothetical protein
MFSMFTDPMVKMSGRGDPDFDKFANRTSRYTSYQQAKNKLTQKSGSPLPLIFTIGSVNIENIPGTPPNILFEFGETID